MGGGIAYAGGGRAMKRKGGKMVPNCVKENVEVFYEQEGKGYGYTFEFL